MKINTLGDFELTIKMNVGTPASHPFEVEFVVPEEKLLPYEEEDFCYEEHHNETEYWESLFKTEIYEN